MKLKDFIARIGKPIRAGVLSNYELAFIDLSLGSYRDFSFDHVDFFRVNMTASLFVNCGFYGRFNECNFYKAVFKKCILINADFLNVSIEGALFDQCEINYVDFGETDLLSGTFRNCKIGRIWPEDKKHLLES